MCVVRMPVVGDLVDFTSSTYEDTRPAKVSHVWHDSLVNLVTLDDRPLATSVRLVDNLAADAPRPDRNFCRFPARAEPAMAPPVQPAITGYRMLSDSEVALMNKIKAMATEVGSLVAELRSCAATPAGVAPQPCAGWHGTTIDQRWVSLGATDLQTGFMALTRAVAQPSTF